MGAFLRRKRNRYGALTRSETNRASGRRDRASAGRGTSDHQYWIRGSRLPHHCEQSAARWVSLPRLRQMDHLPRHAFLSRKRRRVLGWRRVTSGRRLTAQIVWDDRDSNPDALSGNKFSHHYGFRHNLHFCGPDCALTISFSRRRSRPSSLYTFSVSEAWL